MGKFYYEHYRNTSIGMCLADTLDEMISDGRIVPQLAVKIMENFDKAMGDALAERVKSKMSFKGHLDTYRLCDEVWTFIIKQPTFRFENETVSTEKVRIIAQSSKQKVEGQ
ncbi:Transcription initiation factor IIA subunit 2 [Saitoella coloradoensis]